jgi:hypothetical protein
MLPDYLPPEKNAETKEPSQLRNFLETEYSVERANASLRDLNLLPGAMVEVHGRAFPCTQNFLEDLAAAIGMPVAYAYEIDFNLFQHNFDQRKPVKDHAVQVCISSGRAVGLAHGEYRPARTIDILESLALYNSGFWKLQKGSLSDRCIEIDLLSEDFTVQPKPGDEIRVGVRITNSETGACGLKASLFTHRLVCSNGAVMSDRLGTVRWNYDRRVTYISSIANFTRGLLNLRHRQNQLAAVYSSAVERQILEEDVTRLWRRIRSAGNFTPERADSILGITSDERRRIASAVAERHTAGQPAEPGPWNIFTIHNRITAAARTLPFHTRSRLEQIGGDVLTAYSSN